MCEWGGRRWWRGVGLLDIGLRNVGLLDIGLLRFLGLVRRLRSVGLLDIGLRNVGLLDIGLLRFRGLVRRLRLRLGVVLGLLVMGGRNVLLSDLFVEHDRPDDGPDPADQEYGEQQLENADGYGGTIVFCAHTAGDHGADAGEEHVDSEDDHRHFLG